jgi:hypothetical protein
VGSEGQEDFNYDTAIREILSGIFAAFAHGIPAADNTDDEHHDKWNSVEKGNEG